MSRDPRKPFGLPPRDRDRDRVVWGRSDYRRPPRSPNRKRSRSRSPPMRTVNDNVRGRSPRRSDKDLLDENILSEISKLPEPSELWDNQHQDPNFASAPPPPTFQPETSNSSYPNYQPSYSGVYDDFPSMASVPQAQIPPEIASWNQMSLPPPPVPTTQSFVNNIEDQIKKEAAIESEMRHQKAALSKQREDYIKKAGILKKELDTLKDQRNELRGDAKRSPSPDTKRFLKENTKLQLEIQNKLKTINNVVDMLNGIIGEDAQEIVDSDDSERTSKPRKSRSPSGKKFNYVYYDPEMHWCRVCNEFPPTAKDYLNHLHSPAHHKMAAAHMEAPWHSVSGVNEGFPSYPSAATKRTPIRGLQFFVPSTAWYCKLCDQFIGDLHCASAHLKSTVHSKNYTNFVEQNPHWETDWMSDRQKAFEKAQGKGKAPPADKPQQYTSHTITFHKDGFHSKQRKGGSPPPVAEKKRKKEKKRKSKRKHSSSDSSSSQSSSSDSEREKKKKKKIKKEKERFQPDEKALTEWMSSIQMERLNESDRKLLDNIKSRLKKEKGESKRRSPERPVRVRESSVDSRKTRETERRSQSSRERRSPPRSPARSPRARSPRAHSPRPHSPRARSPRQSREERRRERDKSRQRSPSAAKKPEIKKMPFIGKMPVYKSLGLKSKTDEQKKEEEKKKEDDEASKKRREEMDAEIQKKVAEFKEKIARAQLERQAQVELPPPGVALPQALAAPPPQPPPAYMPQPYVPIPAEFQEQIARAHLERQAQVELPPPGVALPQALAAPPPQPPPAYMPQPYVPIPAEFQEQIARAHLERQAQVELPPPGVALPQALAAPPPQPPPAYMPQPAPPATAPPTPQPSLPKDFQEALDIIFPTPEMKQEISATTDGLLAFPPPFPMSLGMPQFSLPGLLPTPQMPQLPMQQMQQMQQMPPGMFSFDLNAPLFQHNPHQPRAQLYDTHVPLVPSPKPQQHRQNQNQNQNRQNKNNRPKQSHTKIKPLMAESVQPPPVQVKTENKENGAAAAKKEEMDDLAMLGIDASDVGANV